MAILLPTIPEEHMPLGVVEGELILRAWDRTAELSETSASFSSLDELYAY